MVVHLSWILPPYIKGKTQLPHPVVFVDGVGATVAVEFVVGNTVAVTFVEGVGAAVVGEGVDPCVSNGPHVYQSSTVF